MKRFAALLVLAFVTAFAADTTPQQQYIDSFSSMAVAEMIRSGVPASITLAQGMLESRYGLSTLASEANNHFGIKCHRNWNGGRTYRDDDAKGECFRVYRSADESFRDHSDFLRYQDRYKSLFELAPTDYKGWAKGLKKAGYATDPKYADKLIKIIEDYSLYRFDSGIPVEAMPQAPLKIEEKALESVPVRAGEHYTVSLSRPEYRNNKVLCVYAEAGDSFASIAAEYKIFLREILSFNDVSADRPLATGEMVYLRAKRRRAADGIPMYVFGDKPESLWAVSQRFGVKMKSILKYNDFPADYVPAEGDRVYLKKMK